MVGSVEICPCQAVVSKSDPVQKRVSLDPSAMNGNICRLLGSFLKLWTRAPRDLHSGVLAGRKGALPAGLVHW